MSIPLDMELERTYQPVSPIRGVPYIKTVKKTKHVEEPKAKSPESANSSASVIRERVSPTNLDNIKKAAVKHAPKHIAQVKHNTIMFMLRNKPILSLFIIILGYWYRKTKN